MPEADKATLAGSFGAVAEVYQRARPGFPATAVEWALGLEPLEVLDLGAGTGKLTGALLAAGHRVTALEPLAEMRAILVASHPEAAAVEGRAEDLPFAAASFDAVVAGSAFHWFDRAPALAEVARVLRRPGIFGLLGNRFDTSIDWQRHLRDRSDAGGSRISSRDHWPGQPQLRESYAEVKDAAFVHRVEVDRTAIRDYAASTSRISTLPPAAREEAIAAVDRIWDEDPELRGLETVELVWRAVVRRSRGLLPA